jgi:hypothetical protein
MNDAPATYFSPRKKFGALTKWIGAPRALTFKIAGHADSNSSRVLKPIA